MMAISTYAPKVWLHGEIIYKEPLNHMEQGIYQLSQQAEESRSELETALAQEISRAESAESLISQSVSNEAARAIGRETEISTELAEEATRANEAEVILAQNLAGVDSKATAAYDAMHTHSNKSVLDTITQDDIDNWNAGGGGGGSGVFGGACSSDASAQVKEVDVTAGGDFELVAGAYVAVKFTNTNTYSATVDAPCQLDVGGTGAKTIYGAGSAAITGTNTTYFGRAGYVNYYYYDGTYWVWAGSSADDNSAYTPQALGFGYGTCATAEATAAKAVTLSGYALVANGIVSVKFTYGVPANATLNINSKGAKPIYFQGTAIIGGVIKAGDVATFVYNGSQYVLTSIDTEDECIEIAYSEYKSLSEDEVRKHKYLITDYPTSASSSLVKLTKTLSAGETTLSFTDARLMTDTYVFPPASNSSDLELVSTEFDDSANTITFTFKALSADVTVAIVALN